ncbi:MAG: MBOAT family O-acyltransferase [Hyphomicrobiaceae bacterium]|nr:MBOAT family O-acyltransferase [Hyphomicrobiaceae bacterium]
MLFNSQVFILGFLPIVLALYYALARRKVAREWMLVLTSLVFYGWWDIRFLPLLVGQTLISWLLSEWHFAEKRRGRRGRLPLWLGIVGNLAVLGVYKYLDFAVDMLESASGLDLPRAELILPIGISFYTFQIVSYLIDALRQEAPRYGGRRFALFVVLYPQLVAGPIVRHNEIIAQFDLDPLRTGLAERMGRGLCLFIIALLAKVFIADPLAGIADPVFAAAATSPPTLALSALGLLAFGLQIFFDFAAYSEMAVGLGWMLGLSLPMNFNQPYRATSLQDFWRRWHMTLSRFLRDYLYIPLGGSRQGTARFMLASLTTMGLCGLWHGAGVTFILWGLAHGVGLLVVRGWRELGVTMPALLGWALTFSFAILTFGLFRAPDLASAGNLFAGLAGTAGLGVPWDIESSLVVLLALTIALVPQPALVLVERQLWPSRLLAAGLALATAFTVLSLGQGAPQSFIYFQF